jgi:hypothetical protein
MNLKQRLIGLVTEVATEVYSIHEEARKEIESLPEPVADIVNTNNQLDTGVWEPNEEHPNIVHGGW